jgi:hypothetical protein
MGSESSLIIFLLSSSPSSCPLINGERRLEIKGASEGKFWRWMTERENHFHLSNKPATATTMAHVVETAVSALKD